LSLSWGYSVEGGRVVLNIASVDGLGGGAYGGEKRYIDEPEFSSLRELDSIYHSTLALSTRSIGIPNQGYKQVTWKGNYQDMRFEFILTGLLSCGIAVSAQACSRT
jgi:hypothetical protein